MPNVSFQAQNEYSTEAADIERRRRYAEALQQQAMQPMGGTDMAGGWAIQRSPLEGIAKLVQGYAAGKSLEDASARQKALGERYTADRGAALAGALRAGQGSPASSETIMDEQAAGGEGAPAQINAPAIAGSRQAMIAALTGSKFPDLQAAGMAQMMKESEPFTLAAGAKRFNGATPIADNPKVEVPKEHVINGKVYVTGPNGLIEKGGPGEGTWGDPYELNGAMVQKNATTGQVRQAVSREPQIKVHQEAPITAVTLQDPNNPNGTIIVDGRSGRFIGQGPKLTDAGKLENKRQFNAQGIGAAIQEAEDLLSGKATGTAPTQSGVGAAVDFGGRLIGKSPKGAKEAAALEAVGGALVTKMPRMEGPQSDKDVALYKEMAAKVGDRTVPIGERQMALNKVKDLWSKYERLNPDAFAPPAAGGGAGGLSPAEQTELEQLRARFKK